MKNSKMNRLQTKAFFRSGMVVTMLALTVLSACGRPQEAVQTQEPVRLSETAMRLYAAPPALPGEGKVDLKAQAMGAFAELRNQAQAKGFALQSCNQLVIFVRQDAVQANGWKPVQRATKHYFGTPLTPNSPPVQMIAVQGFANPGQLLLVEADFSR